MERPVYAQLRIMVLSGKNHGTNTLRSVLSIAGVTKIILVEDCGRAMEMLSMDHFDAVFAEEGTARMEGIGFALAVRRKHGIINPMIPIFIFQERARRRDVEQARDIGANDYLTCPISPKTVMTKLAAAIMAPRPFIKAPEFFGPDRRARARPAWYGEDRRSRAARKVQVQMGGLPPDSFLV